ncbi:hypothetical protein LZ012_18350 [Dechloromonas sp. XY25]|uniref:Lipoprotein n=1 Tax=Dechloromonas hankyongensis TaxID=2908002 RepID=A0ABS9K707_9RHOO|nr:hypothetical protein [Dechloromonas hankyongensis]MCG2578957.1 hypothetical protein [Dechloromonas hankyongensis]
MDAFRHVVHHFLMVVLLAVSGACSAEFANPVAEGTRWACWYSPAHLTVQCLLTRAPENDHLQRAAEVASRIDRRLPALVKMIWGSPEKLAGTHISIPLMNVPFKMTFVSVLAKSVMCGSRLDCSVHFDGNADGMAPVRAAALESGSSEAEVMAEMNAQGLKLAQAEAEPRYVEPAPVKKVRRGMFAG